MGNEFGHPGAWRRRLRLGAQCQGGRGRCSPLQRAASAVSAAAQRSAAACALQHCCPALSSSPQCLHSSNSNAEWLDFPREGNDWSYHYCRRQWVRVLPLPRLRCRACAWPRGVSTAASHAAPPARVWGRGVARSAVGLARHVLFSGSTHHCLLCVPCVSPASHPSPVPPHTEPGGHRPSAVQAAQRVGRGVPARRRHLQLHLQLLAVGHPHRRPAPGGCWVLGAAAGSACRAEAWSWHRPRGGEEPPCPGLLGAPGCRRRRRHWVPTAAPQPRARRAPARPRPSPAQVLVAERGPLVFVFNFSPFNDYQDLQVGCGRPASPGNSAEAMHLPRLGTCAAGWQALRSPPSSPLLTAACDALRAPPAAQVPVPEPGTWRVALDSDGFDFGGKGRVHWDANHYTTVRLLCVCGQGLGAGGGACCGARRQERPTRAVAWEPGGQACALRCRARPALITPALPRLAQPNPACSPRPRRRTPAPCSATAASTCMCCRPPAPWWRTAR